MLAEFPFLLGRAFIEAHWGILDTGIDALFPFLLGRAFIEAKHRTHRPDMVVIISLPFGKGFH